MTKRRIGVVGAGNMGSGIAQKCATEGFEVVLVDMNEEAAQRGKARIDELLQEGVARKVFTGDPVDLTMGFFNAIWQGDANGMALASLAHAAAPPLILNIAGPEELSVRATCEELARLLGRAVSFTGHEAPDALLNNAARGWSLFGRPRISASQLIAWTADWVARGGPSLDKPTHFESRDGRF